MAEPNTYLKLHRSILESAVFSDAEVLRLWIYFLCKASTEDRETIISGSIVKIKKGQLITGRKKLSEAIGIPESKVYRSLKLLEDLRCITIEANNKFSVISVVNWAKFQDAPKKVNSKTTTKQQQTNSKTTTDEQQTNTVKELKNYKELYKLREGAAEPPTPPPDTNTPLRGLYKNVRLTDTEYSALAEKFPTDFSTRVERLSKYMADTGKTYASHYDTILRWAEQDAEKGQPKADESDFNEDDYFEAALRRSERYLQKNRKQKENDDG